MVLSGAVNGVADLLRKSGLLYSERPADLFRKGGRFTPKNASVAYLLKRMGKQVLTNDFLWSSYWTAVALVENNHVVLSESDIKYILETPEREGASHFVSETFKDYYFTNDENAWLDTCHQNISDLCGQYTPAIARLKRALALHCLFQSALRKRPFNMFHRRNLQLRLATVKRTFGNATTWSRPFATHFRELADETKSLVFSNDKQHRTFRKDALSWHRPPVSDLVYIDPPYVWEGASQAEVSYLAKYHFLEGLARYDEWPTLIDRKSPLLQLCDGYRPWPGGVSTVRSELLGIYKRLVSRFHDRIIVLSYREPGVPGIDEIAALIKCYKQHVYCAKWPYWYALRKSMYYRQRPNEVVLVGFDGSYSGPGEEIVA